MFFYVFTYVEMYHTPTEKTPKKNKKTMRTPTHFFVLSLISQFSSTGVLPKKVILKKISTNLTKTSSLVYVEYMIKSPYNLYSQKIFIYSNLLSTTCQSGKLKFTQSDTRYRFFFHNFFIIVSIDPKKAKPKWHELNKPPASPQKAKSPANKLQQRQHARQDHKLEVLKNLIRKANFSRLAHEVSQDFKTDCRWKGRRSMVPEKK